MTDKHAQWLAEKLVEASRDIPNFFNRSGHELGVTWGFVNSVTRDDKPLVKSNYYRTEKSMLRRFPSDADCGRATHFLTGWVDQLMVRMLDDKGVVTKAGLAVLDRLRRKHQSPTYRALAYMTLEFEGELKKPREGTPRDPRNI